MRVMSRLALVIALLAVSVPTLQAGHLQGDCPLSLVAQNPPATNFDLSPHGVFRNGNLVHVLRGQVLSTYTVNDIGDLTVAREDFVGSMGARETEGGVAFGNGHLFISSEAGLEIYDLRNVRAGGNAPILVSRTANLHYRRLAVRGNLLAGTYPISDYPCAPGVLLSCFNTVDLINITNLAAPVRVSMLNSAESRLFLGFHDVGFANQFLITTTESGVIAFNVDNPAVPVLVSTFSTAGRSIISNGTNIFGAISDYQIDLFTVRTSGLIERVSVMTAPQYMTIERANRIAFSRHGWLDEANGRVVALINEIDPQTQQPARTIAFDVFDLTAPFWEGSAQRIYENVSMLEDDEVKYNPVVVGPYVYTVGESTGLQTWGACGVVTGRIELDSLFHLPCGGAEIHGWVTGAQKIANVELFLDSGALGAAALGQTRNDVSSRTPVQTFRINVNLDNTTRGEHILRAVGTDTFGNRRQFASQRIFFPGPGANCTTRRRSVR